MAESTESQRNSHHQTRRVVLGAAATLGMLAPAAPTALAAGIGDRRPDRRPAEGGAAPDGSGQAPDGVLDADSTSEVWGASASGRGAGVRGNGRTGVVGEGTHTGVAGDGFIGVRGRTSIVEGDQSGVGVWAQAAAPGSTALRADGRSEFNGVTKFGRSGVATVRQGSESVTVTGVTLTAESAILATLQNRVDEVCLHAVETDAAAGAFTVFLTTAPDRDMKVAWLALG